MYGDRHERAIFDELDDAQRAWNHYRRGFRALLGGGLVGVLMIVGGGAVGSVSGLLHLDLGGLCWTLIVVGVVGMVVCFFSLWGWYIEMDGEDRARRLRQAERAVRDLTVQ